MFALVSADLFWIVPVVIIAAREVGISVYRIFAGAKGVSVPASRMAKYKTLTQQLAVGFAIIPLTAVDATVAVEVAAVDRRRAHRGQRHPVPVAGAHHRARAGARPTPR